ncbi:diphthine synthase-like isoform X2 [Dinothrombium tinctorium]|uniref:diphthine methyl ester synthase n=1 Tax=Dinothrombium tinctorium TaxID=1965070 RepID=A0A3S3PP01_9ACAR|nr:diphthine synthase-like isoform X2 [Dinothrombium tinctorium]
MLYLIGLGLGDVTDITFKGLQIVRKVDKVFLESYTSILCANRDKTDLEKFYGREVIVADRETVETEAELILDEAVNKDVAMLVVGDPFGATTHTDLILRAVQKNIPYKVIHNASIMNAIGCCGLQLYSFGETVSIPFWTDSWKPESFFEKIVNNIKNNLHTLCLLGAFIFTLFNVLDSRFSPDIKVKEKSIEALMKGKQVYEKPRFMTVDIAAKQILEIIEQRNQENDYLCSQSLAVGLARVGADDQKIKYCSLLEMSETDIGPPLHCLIIPSRTLHPLEEEMLKLFR